MAVSVWPAPLERRPRQSSSLGSYGSLYGMRENEKLQSMSMTSPNPRRPHMTDSNTRLDCGEQATAADHAATFLLASDIAAERYPYGTTKLSALAECVREAQRRLGQRPTPEPHHD